LSEKRKTALGQTAKRQAKGEEPDIDYSDIPPLTSEQLAAARRPAKKLVAVRLNKELFDWLQRPGEGYSNRINTILRAVMEHQTVR
jgi:uncharacterized protein (DUF4415 family)